MCPVFFPRLVEDYIANLARTVCLPQEKFLLYLKRKKGKKALSFWTIILYVYKKLES